MSVLGMQLDTWKLGYSIRGKNLPRILRIPRILVKNDLSILFQNQVFLFRVRVDVALFYVAGYSIRGKNLPRIPQIPRILVKNDLSILLQKQVSYLG